MSNELPDFAELKRKFDAVDFPTGARAELRRVAALDDVAYCPALYRLFPGQKVNDGRRRIAFLLPCARHAANAKSLGTQLVEFKVAETRVLQVARSKAPLDLIQLRRLLSYVDPVVDWNVFGKTIWYWNDISKRQLVEDYYLAKFAPAKGANK